MTELAEPDVPAFPMPRTCPFAPPPQYQALREQHPVSRVELPSGRTAWVLTRLGDIRAMLTDPRFSSDRQNPNFPLLFKGVRPPSTIRLSMINMDPPEHGPARRAVLGEFTVKRMRARQPRFQEIVDEQIDDLLAGPRPADLVQALALPVSSLAICELLGVPYSDHDFFQARSSKLLRRTVVGDERQTAVDELQSYLNDLVTAKVADPGDDLLSRQILAQRESGEIHHEALASLGLFLLIAGHETTASMISLGTLTLLENPDQLAAIKADPGRTLGAVEELLRYFTIAETIVRVATADVEIGGTLIHAGEGVIGLGSAANRDPVAFEKPDDLDIERGARHHIAFGFGPHQCLGQNLARMELQIVFDTLFHRVPGLRLAAEVNELPFKDDSFIYGLYELPVTW